MGYYNGKKVLSVVRTEYLAPNGNIKLTQNGSYDVSAYKKAVVSVFPSGTTQKVDEEEVALSTSQLPATTLPKGLINYVGGMSQKVNQLVKNGDFEINDFWHSTDESNGTTNISNKELTYSVLQVGTGYLNGFYGAGMPCTTGHKGLVFFYAKASRAGIILGYDVTNTASMNIGTTETSYKLFSSILTTGNTGAFYICTRGGTTEVGDTITFNHIRFADLTNIYGAGNEPTSTTDPRIQWLIHYLIENPQYDEGSIVNAPVEKLSSKGFNIWDEEWEVGRLNFSGDIYTDTTRRTTGFIPVMPNKTYYQCCPSNAGSGWYAFYDKNKQPILVSDVGIPSNSSFTTPSGCAYLRVTFGYGYGTTYNHDICINLSGTMNGTYLPYQTPSDYPIPAEVQALDGYGLGIDDTLYNYIDFERKKFVKKVGSYTFTGQENFQATTYGRCYCDFSSLGIKEPANRSIPAKMICNVLTNVVDNSLEIDDMSISYYMGNIGICLETTEQYGDVSALATYLQNHEVTIIFELTTPTETDISEYLDSDFPNENLIDTYQGGEVEFENENDMGVPYSLTYQYRVE